jgi:hypothetical protein
MPSLQASGRAGGGVVSADEERDEKDLLLRWNAEDICLANRLAIKREVQRMRDLVCEAPWDKEVLRQQRIVEGVWSRVESNWDAYVESEMQRLATELGGQSQ